MSDSAANKLQKRGWLDPVEDVVDKTKDVAGDIKDGVKNGVKNGAKGVYKGMKGIKDLGDGSASKSVTFPISVGKPHKKVKLFQDFRK